ncbi:MAG: hypothetical protein ACRCX2_23180 [Paraclostridium sp.]
MIEYYRDEIEKFASSNNETDSQNALSKKDKILGTAKKIGRSAIDAKANGYAQDAMSKGGAAIGTALALSKGKKLTNAIATGGLAGMAAGDIAGSLVIPTKQLDRQHKKEFGEKADKKSKAMVLGANALPTAALWGVALGNKKIRTKLQTGISDMPKNLKRAVVSQKAAIRDAGRVNTLIDEGKLEQAQKLQDLAQKKMPTRIKHTKDSLKKMMGATAAIGAGGAVAEIPTYIATPRNVIDHKKKKIKQQEEQQ